KPPLVRGGLETTLQLVPSQCSKSVWSGGTLPSPPTAHTSLPATATTASRKPPLRRVGVVTTLQLVPSRGSASVVVDPPLLKTSPTAQMSLAAIAAVPMSREFGTVGLGTTLRPPDNRVRCSRSSKRRGARRARTLFAPRRQGTANQFVMTESSQVRNLCCWM